MLAAFQVVREERNELMAETSHEGPQRREETPPPAEPKGASALTVCGYEEGQEDDVELKTGGFMTGLYRKPGQSAPLPTSTSPRPKPEPRPRRKGANQVGRGKVSFVHLGTAQIGLHYSGL